MTRHVLKYELAPWQGGQHAIPAGSRFLDLQVQDGRPVMWWSVIAGLHPSTWPLRTFLVVPTGPPGYSRDGDEMHYLATFQLGGFVGHVFVWGEMDPAPLPERAS